MATEIKQGYAVCQMLEDAPETDSYFVSPEVAESIFELSKHESVNGCYSISLKWGDDIEDIEKLQGFPILCLGLIDLFIE